MTAVDDPIIHFAIERGLVSAAQVAAVRNADMGSGDSSIIDRCQFYGRVGLDLRRLAQALAADHGFPCVDLAEAAVGAPTRAQVPRDFAVANDVLPIDLDGNRLKVAVGNPGTIECLDALRYLTGLEVESVVAPIDELRAAIVRCYDLEQRADNTLLGLTADADILPDHASLPENAGVHEDAPIASLVHGLIEDAVARRASDIHLEPMERRSRVRYRIDGVLVDAKGPPKPLHLPLVSRLKIMANISIAEKRVPQDGRIRYNLRGRPVDLRVSTLPTAHGESVVMRILDGRGLQLGLAELGLSDHDRRTFEQLLEMRDGMILVTGPTGSGKTTTLYTALHAINRSDRKIITVEDPVEYQLAGINQVPVRNDIGMTFASALRAMLRQAPNVVMVGEIRDRETADMAVNASLTGHLVFSTLHTNDAAGAISRLIDIGVKPFLLASVLRAVVAQRLVRRVCPACRIAHMPSGDELAALGIEAAAAAGTFFAAGVGCDHCSGTGYRGRIGIFEVLVVNDALQSMIHGRAAISKLRENARSAGSMRTLREDGARQVTAGLTTFEEVVSITVDDD